MKAIAKALGLNPYRGSVLDLVGGRNTFTKYPPHLNQTDAQARRVALIAKLKPTPFWPAARPEGIERRLRRMVKALSRIGDLLG